MEIQSLSIVVPLNGCVNDCKFCVSRIHENQYENLVEKSPENWKYRANYIRRLQFARDNGCDTIIFTGIGEPLQNRDFITKFMSVINNEVNRPFVWFELQTSGVMLSNKNLTMLSNFGFSTISLSISDIFDSYQNGLINDIPRDLMFDLDDLCKQIKSFGFNLRLSLNMTSVYSDKTPQEIFNRVKDLSADQVTIRELYKSKIQCKQNQWIDENSASVRTIYEIEKYIQLMGVELVLLPFGARKYSINGISAVVDSDCMSKEAKESIRYLILRENCKLYSKWDDPASLIF